MANLGEIIKQKRLARDWSLKKLGTEIGVTAAYVGDLEANRRLPSADLLKRLSQALDIPSSELAAVDSRLSSDLREWIEERPELISLLRALRTSTQADMLIQRFARFLKRRQPPPPARGFLVIWESELRAIAAEASAWSIETGGDLFGRWHDVPTVLLATKAGPNSQRNSAHFRLDVDYLRELSETLAADWVLRYFGDWHSHHRLGLSSPSGGDQRRILSIAGRNQFPGMAEMIVTLEGPSDNCTIRIHPWLYDFSIENSGPFPIRVKVLQGLSPIRQALLARRVLPEQELHAWEKMSWNRIRIGTDAAPPVLEPIRDVDNTTRERTLAQLADALHRASESPVEQHSTGFGCVLVTKLTEPHYLAFALGATWPMNVLEVHRLDRNLGTTERFDAPKGLAATNINDIVEIFQRAKGG